MVTPATFAGVATFRSSKPAAARIWNVSKFIRICGLLTGMAVASFWAVTFFTAGRCLNGSAVPDFKMALGLMISLIGVVVAFSLARGYAVKRSKRP